MKKEVKRYTVIASLTEDNIKSTGVSLWMQKRTPLFLVMLGFMVGVVLIVEKLDDINKVFDYLGVLLIAVVFMWWFYMIQKVGKAYFNKVKDLPEPIDLRGIK